MRMEVLCFEHACFIDVTEPRSFYSIHVIIILSVHDCPMIVMIDTLFTGDLKNSSFSNVGCNW